VPLLLAVYDDQCWIVLDAADGEHAERILDALKVPMPREFREVPPGTFVAELYPEDEDSEVEDYAERDEVPNPGNHTQVGMAFEPFTPTAAWFRAQLESAEASPAAASSPSPPVVEEAPAVEESETNE
jgi:hypothetical protein